LLSLYLFCTVINRHTQSFPTRRSSDLSKKMITYKSMTALMGILPEEKFVRLHKSFIASVEKIAAVRGNEVGVTLNGEEKYIPIGATYKADVFKKLGIAE